MKPSASVHHETDSTKIPREEIPEQIIEFVRHEEEEDLIGQGWKKVSFQEKEDQLSLLRDKVICIQHYIVSTITIVSQVSKIICLLLLCFYYF